MRRRWIGFAAGLVVLAIAVALSIAVGSRTIGLSTVFIAIAFVGVSTATGYVWFAFLGAAVTSAAQLVEDVFAMPCRVVDDPETSTPMVVPADRHRRRGVRTPEAARA
ncbi:hypothetical protein [Actinoplanes solisilvae]|uniref:hypothetical protein n=1 Tax=Actinoplanes solisilvae TaxID=2486853 RepID=UPI00196A230B|nr:hypothetical protein [Actinoplanes solisilvae]